MLSRKQEIKEYETMLKRNDEEISRLTGVNKHIKLHLKFLRSLDAEEKGTEEVFVAGEQPSTGDYRE